MLLRLAEKQYLAILYEMDFSKKQIQQKMKKRILMAVIMGTLLSTSFIILKLYLFIPIGIIIAFIIFKIDKITLNKKYEKFQLDREIEFTRFTQLIIPYLKREKGQDTLYLIFSKLISRVDDSLKRSLYILMNEMVANPYSPEPFENFAKKCSSQDYAINIMHCLYDYANNSTDSTVIEELSELVNRQLLKRVKDVMEIKNNKASKRPMLIAMSLLIIMIPYLLLFVVNQITNSGLL